jgi:hypothetical protein
MNTPKEEYDAFGYPKDGKLRCGFCYPREQFTHGEVKLELCEGWNAVVPMCRKHARLDRIHAAMPSDL